MARWDFPVGEEQSSSEAPTPGKQGPYHHRLASRQGLVGGTDHRHTSDVDTVAQTHHIHMNSGRKGWTQSPASQGC